MNNPKEDTALVQIENRVRDLEARVKKLENWKLVHTSMNEEEKHTNQYIDSNGVTQSFSRRPAIQLGDYNGEGSVGLTLVQNNVFQSNPRDTREDPALPPYGIGSHYFDNANLVKDKAFIIASNSQDASKRNLPQLITSGNTDDGMIVVDGSIYRLLPTL